MRLGTIRHGYGNLLSTTITGVFLGWSSERKWYLLSTGVYGLQVLFLDDDGHIDP